MGQLRLISNLIQKQAKDETWMRAYTEEANWVSFCDTYLAQLNDINDGRQLGRSKPNDMGTQSDGEEEEDMPIPLDSNFEFRSPDQPDELFDHNDDAGCSLSRHLGCLAPPNRRACRIPDWLSSPHTRQLSPFRVDAHFGAVGKEGSVSRVYLLVCPGMCLRV